jgi:hypothetical protein
LLAIRAETTADGRFRLDDYIAANMKNFGMPGGAQSDHLKISRE